MTTFNVMTTNKKHKRYPYLNDLKQQGFRVLLLCLFVSFATNVKKNGEKPTMQIVSNSKLYKSQSLIKRHDRIDAQNSPTPKKKGGDIILLKTK